MKKLLTFLFTIITVTGFSQSVTVTVGQSIPSIANADSLAGKGADFYVDTLNDQSAGGEKTFKDTVKISKAIRFSDGSILTNAEIDTATVSLDSDSLNSKASTFYVDTATNQNIFGLKIFKTQLTVDNIDINGNTISATNLNGDLILDAFAAGTGVVKVTDQLEIEGETSQLLLTDTDNDKTFILKSNTGDFSIVEVGGNNAFKILGGAAVNSLKITANQVEIGTRLDVDNLRLDANTISSTDLNGNINLSPNGTGDVIVNSVFETVGGNNGTVGGFPAGNLMVRSSGTGVNASANITGHNSFNINKQLWVLGSLSSSNDDVTFINRQNANLSFFTNNTLAVTVEADGDVVFEKSIKIKGGVPDAGKVLTSDAVGFARWETPGTGDVVGPASSTDNALARYNLATGKLIQNSVGILSDVGALSGLTLLTVDNIQVNGNTISTTTGDLDITTATLDVTATPGTIIGGFPSGALHVTDPSTSQFANSVITGHNSFGGNKQLWYLGSTSSSNDNIAFINRQTGSLSFQTSNALRVTIEDAGNVVLENQIRIKGGIPGVNKVLTSDAVGLATWETPSVVGVTEANFFSATDNTTQTVAVANTFQTITFATNDELDGWTHTAGTDSFTCNQTGKYRGSVTMQLQKTGGASSLAEFRLTINGVPAGSGHTFVQDLITNNEIKLLTATNLVSLTSGDVVRFEFTSNTTTTEIVLPVTTGANPISIVAAFDRIQ